MKKVLKLVQCLVLVLTIGAAPMLASASSVKLLRTTVKGARMREGSSGSSSIMRSLKKNEPLFYIKTKGSVCQVRTEYGEIGWVYKGYLSQYATIRRDQIYAAKSGAKLYSKANKSSKSTSLSKGQHVIVYLTQGDWAYVKTMRGKAGFVQLSALQYVS